MDIMDSVCLSIPVFVVVCCPLPKKHRYILATEKKKHFFFAEHAKNLIALSVAAPRMGGWMVDRIAGETIACEKSDWNDGVVGTLRDFACNALK